MSGNLSSGRSLVLFCTILLASVRPACADVIAFFGFEVNTPADLTDSATYPQVAADFGANAFVSGAHQGAGTDWRTPFGNGSQNSFSAVLWAAGDYFQFQGSTLGFEQISLEWDQARSPDGSASFILAYSTEAVPTTFTPLGSPYSVLLNDTVANGGAGTWSNVGARNSAYTFNFSGLPAIDNQENVTFRLIAAVNGAGPNGSVRVDNFTITGIPIPLPPAATAGLALLALLVAAQIIHRLNCPGDTAG